MGREPGENSYGATDKKDESDDDDDDAMWCKSGRGTFRNWQWFECKRCRKHSLPQIKHFSVIFRLHNQTCRRGSGSGGKCGWGRRGSSPPGSSSGSPAWPAQCACCRSGSMQLGCHWSSFWPEKMWITQNQRWTEPPSLQKWQQTRDCHRCQSFRLGGLPPMWSGRTSWKLPFGHPAIF